MAFGQDGDIQVGCGIMAMVMEMFGGTDLITFGQFVGVVLLVNGIWSWRFPDIASENLKSIGMLFALGGLLFTAIILFHILTGAVAGATPYINVILTAIFTAAFYSYSR